MKKLSLILVAVLFTVIGIFAQTPNQFKYQAVLRNADGTIMANENITVEINILKGSATGISVFSEIHNVTTTAQGLINLNIGSINDLSVVDWNADTYFIKIKVNGTVMGISQLLSVPYALTAQNVENVDYSQITNTPTIDGSETHITAGTNVTVTGTGTNTDPYVINTDDQTLAEVLTESNDAGAKQIKNLADPTDEQDAVTKAYVDHKFDMLSIAKNGVTDYDGNHYNAVLIGNQIWMAENLKVTHYPNGDPIPLVTNNTDWANLADTNTDDAYCFYNNDANSNYGVLYTYAAAIGDNWTRDNTVNQGVCPDGWHLPTDAEWQELVDYLGGSTIAGGKMKETGTLHWNGPNTGATNESGFSALPGGFRNTGNGLFYEAGTYGYWWSATEYSSTHAYGRFLGYGSAEVGRNNYVKSDGFSVRCIKDK